MQLLAKKDDDQVGLALNLLTRFGFLFYWIFDNLVVLCTTNFLKRDSKSFNKTGMSFWLLALTASLIYNVRSLIGLIQKEQEFKRVLIGSQKEPENKDILTKLDSIRKQRETLFLNIIKVLGDMIPAGQGRRFLSGL